MDTRRRRGEESWRIEVKGMGDYKEGGVKMTWTNMWTDCIVSGIAMASWIGIFWFEAIHNHLDE